MPEFTVYNTETGQVRCTGTMATVEWCQAQAGPGESVHMGQAPADTYIVDDAPVPMPPKPSDRHVFDWSAHAWIDRTTIKDLRESLKADLAQRRWQVETGGLTLPSGVRVKTEREDRAALVAAVADLEDLGTEPMNFKARDGFVLLSLEEAKAALRAVNEHVRLCFEAERAHWNLIDSITSREVLCAYDTASFPRLPAISSLEE